MPESETKFLNPYEGCVRDNNYCRLNSDVRKDDFNFIRSLRPTVGTMQATINILWKKLADECRKRGITSCAKESEFEHFVLNCKLVLDSDGRRTAVGPGGSDAEEPSGHVDGRTSGLCPGPTNSPIEHATVEKPSGKRKNVRTGKTKSIVE